MSGLFIGVYKMTDLKMSYEARTLDEEKTMIIFTINKADETFYKYFDVPTEYWKECKGELLRIFKDRIRHEPLLNDTQS